MKKKGTIGGLLVSLEIILFVAILVLVIVKPFGSGNNSERTQDWSARFRTENTENTETMYQWEEDTQSDSKPLFTDDTEPESDGDTSQTSVTEPEKITFSQEVEDKIEDMTLEEQIAQMFIITPEELTGVGQVNVSGNGTKSAIEEYPVGGLVYSSKNFQGKEQTTQMLTNVKQFVQDRVGLSLFLAIEEEGGKDYSPLATALGYETADLPSEWKNTGLVQKNSSKIAGYLSDLGFNMNIALMTDLNSGNGNYYDKRSLGSGTDLVTELLAVEINEYEKKNLETVLKFFPEKTSSVKDSSTGYLVSSRTWNDITADELVVLKSGVEAGADVIMVSNVVDTKLTNGTEVPCCMSSGVVEYLRNSLDYQGLLMTDSLSNEAITKNYSSAEAAVAAVNAGVDILYMPEDFTEAYQAVVDGVNAGDISENTIHNAVGRVLTEKYEMEES